MSNLRAPRLPTKGEEILPWARQMTELIAKLIPATQFLPIPKNRPRRGSVQILPTFAAVEAGQQPPGNWAYFLPLPPEESPGGYSSVNGTISLPQKAIASANGKLTISADEGFIELEVTAQSEEEVADQINEAIGNLSTTVGDLLRPTLEVKEGENSEITITGPNSALVLTIKNDKVSTEKIKDAAVTTAKIKDGDVTTAKIKDGDVTNAKLAAPGPATGFFDRTHRVNVDDKGRIVSVEVNPTPDPGGAGGITQLTGAVTAGPGVGIQAASITDKAVTTDKLDDGAVTTGKIDAEAVTEAKIGADAVSTAKLKDGSVATAKIQDNAVTSEKIGLGEVKTINIALGAVDEERLATDAVTASKIKNGAVETAKIADGAVSTPKIGDGAVTLAKMADPCAWVEVEFKTPGGGCTTGFILKKN